MVQWLSSVAWDGLVGLFGGEAAQLFFHVPFFVGILIVLALEGAIGFLGYEFIHQAQKWGSMLLGVLYVILSWRILDKGNLPMHGSVHGSMAVAMFVLMSTIAFSGSFSWASYAADYSRYQKKDSPSVPIFFWTLGGLASLTSGCTPLDSRGRRCSPIRPRRACRRSSAGVSLASLHCSPSSLEPS